MQTIARRALGKADNHSRAWKNTTARLTLTQEGRSTKGRGETCRQLRQDRGPTCKKLRHRRQIGTEPIGRRAIGILSILLALTTGDFFFRVRTCFLFLEKTSRQPRERGVNSTLQTYGTYRVAEHDHISSREHAWPKSCKAQDCTSLSPKQLSSTCHVPFLAAPDADHMHEFSLTHLIYLTYLSDSVTSTHKIYGTRSIFTLRCSTAEWRINTNPISHTFQIFRSHCAKMSVIFSAIAFLECLRFVVPGLLGSELPMTWLETV